MFLHETEPCQRSLQLAVLGNEATVMHDSTVSFPADGCDLVGLGVTVRLDRLGQRHKLLALEPFRHVEKS